MKTYPVGDLEYLRAYVEDVGVKTVCIDDVNVEPQRERLAALDTATAGQLHPDHDAVSAEWFDLRSRALQLRIAHERGQLLSITNSLVRLEPYQLACVNWVMQRVLDGERGAVGLKMLPFVDDPGITHNYRVRFEDGTGEVIREELVPVFVDAAHNDPQERLGQRIVDGDSIDGSPDEERIRVLLENEGEMRSSADRYVSHRVESRRDELQRRRREETQQELADLEAYAESERERIETFISDYERKAEAGTDMDIAIRKQRDRLSKLEDRIEQRREELR